METHPLAHRCSFGGRAVGASRWLPRPTATHGCNGKMAGGTRLAAWQCCGAPRENRGPREGATTQSRDAPVPQTRLGRVAGAPAAANKSDRGLLEAMEASVLQHDDHVSAADA